MPALRQEAFQMLNEMPENLMATLVEFMHKLKNEDETPVQDEPEPEIKPETETKKPRKLTEEEFQKLLHSGSGLDPKKAAAFARLEELRKNNTVHYPAGTNWKKEFEEAICESEKYRKYFVAD